MAKVGKFEEIVETQDNDLIGLGDRAVVYTLAGDDRLRAIPDSLLGTQSTTALVGGSGDDTYEASSRGVTIVMDAGKNRDEDFLIAAKIGINRQSSFVADIDNRHLLTGDVNTGQFVLLIDWKNPKNRIERVRLSDREYSYGEIASTYKKLGNYLGSPQERNCWI